MKIGDLVRVRPCGTHDHSPMACRCFFCRGKSNRVGFVAAAATHNRWHVSFDCGQTCLDDFDIAQGYIKVISSSVAR